jgi:hypothetical protein
MLEWEKGGSSMNKIKVLIWICLVVLLFCGCKDASDSSTDQAPTPIEEEQTIQDAPEMVLVDNGEPETAQALGTYFVETKVAFEFGEEEIFNEQDEIGRYIEGVPYFDLPKIAARLGWASSAGEGLSIEKGNLQYQFDEKWVQRISLDERGSPYDWQFAPIMNEESMMIAQMDLETLFGLQSRWDPETRTLILIEWGWRMPESIQIGVRGDRITARMRWKAKVGEEEIIDDFPWIQLVDREGNRFSQGGYGQSENEFFVVETEGGDLIPGTPWTGTAQVSFRGRLLDRYPLRAEFDTESDEIQIQIGPWEDFRLESPLQFYTESLDTFTIKGSTEDEWVEIQANRLVAEEFERVFDERQEADDTFKWEFDPKVPGIYRIELWSGKDDVRMKRTHFYYEVESTLSK